MAEFWRYDRDRSEVVHYDEEGVEVDSRPFTPKEQADSDAVYNGVIVASAQAELQRASLLNSAPEELAALQQAILAAEGISDGDPWRQPTGAHDAYPLGAHVTHNGKEWESSVAANVWEPGVSGWQESGPGIPDWVQPTGGHDAYAAGAVVRHNGLVWSSDVDANVWEPGVFGWTEIIEP